MKTLMNISTRVKKSALKEQAKAIKMILGARTDEETKRGALKVLEEIANAPINISDCHFDGRTTNSYPEISHEPETEEE